MNKTIFKRTVSMILSVIMLISCLPIAGVAADADYARVADGNTMDNWKKYFDLDKLDSSNAGGVWTDKSVFTDASEFPNSVTMIDDSQNFLTALSTIAANKEVVGYSTVPTDTVLVLDLSNSMPQNARTQLIDAANNAIKRLLEINKNNRVGVVLYSGDTSPRTYENAVTRLMPLDRYTTTRSDGKFISFSNGTVSVYSGVSGEKSGSSFGRKSYEGATYIQAGLWEAYEMFNEIPDEDIIVGANNWQSGEYRMPIVVLMSDGAPTLGASKFDDVKNQTYGRYNSKGADVGDGSSSGVQVGQGFLVQLTASYIKNSIENKYRVQDENGAGRSLFYTLGFNLSTISNATAKSVASAVLNPDGSTLTDGYWATYNQSGTNQMSVSVEGTNGGTTNVTVTKNSYATSKSYVDKYFSASGDGLTKAFDDIVEEIILQSRYYPTHLEGGSPDFSGYVEFTDTLGEYMEVKHINGILLGDTLYDGKMMASKFADNSADGLGTPENPTELGDEFIRAVKTRLGIAETSVAQALVQKAFADGQLRYNSATDWSNYIAWYAKADNTFAGFYDEDGTEPIPEGAAYINRSYGFLGETSGSIKNSDMMYMSVQVRTHIATKDQTVSWRIPASLVPMITYMVSLKGTSVDKATDVEIAVENAQSVAPIRLVYETGLRADLNPFNITDVMGESINAAKKTDEWHIDTDGHTRLFWNNSFDISGDLHDDHITAKAEFTPNKENERFYYTFDSAVHKKDGENYVLVGQSETLDEAGEYYHRRYIFKEGENKPVFLYEKMSAASIKAAKDNGWQDDFETLDNQRTGAWVIPKGTPARELQMYDETKAQNQTNSAEMVFHPYISEQNNTIYIDMNLGNNGLMKVTPATGIKISKTVDFFQTGTSDTFKFRVTASVSGRFDCWITPLDQTPSGEAADAVFTNGIYEAELKKDQTLWIAGLPAGTTYTVEEISENADYKIKSVHVNGQAKQSVADGTVSQHRIDDIEFVNTAIGEGDLVVTKKVVDAQGNVVDINDSVKFTAEISLTDSSGAPLAGTFDSSAGRITLQNGKHTVSLSEGESFVVRGIPEETRYAVEEKNIPAGFALNREESDLSGVVDASSNDQALIVNTYRPVGLDGGEVDVRISKEISGNRTHWLAGESYTFRLEQIDAAGGAGRTIKTVTIHADDAQKTRLFDLADVPFDAPGTYYFKITEQTGEQGGITYDTADRLFSVTVADADLDGDLEITAVENQLNTTVSGQWLVTAAFRNTYAPAGSATASIDIHKAMSGGHALNGYQFALYNADPSVNSQADVVLLSGLTDAQGEARMELTYSAADAGKTFTYYLAEVNRGETINNIKYSEAVYKVEIAVVDNLDGTVSAQTTVHGLAAGATVPTFENQYVPSASDFITLSGKKEIEGERALNANEFAFKLEAVTAGAPMPAETTVRNAANGSFSFPAIEFGDGHKGNSYVYRISEVKENPIGGFTYDETVYTVTVDVADNGDQTITATANINNGVQDVENILFKNAYDAKDAEVVLKGTKLLTGKTLQANEFSFELKALTAGAPMPASAVAKNNVAGEIIFDKIIFPKAGVYVYELSEKTTVSDIYDYDASVYTVTVTVTDNSRGVLSAQVAMTKNNMPSSEIVFRNGFVPTPITYDLSAQFGGEKVLEGRDGKPLGEGEFEFALINARTGAQIGETVFNDANGKIKFPAVTLETEGIYHFKMVEVEGDANGITYDGSSFHIRLEVEQDDDGTLSVISKELHKGTVSQEDVGGVLTEVASYANITGSTIRFTNGYEAAAVEVTLEATKLLSGRDLKDGEFKFDLHQTPADYAYSNTTLLQDDVALKLQPDGTGAIAFDPLVFDAVGTYHYVILEDEVNEKGITIDPTTHKVEITVADDYNGNLTATLKINGLAVEGSIAEAVKFQNVYKAAETEILIKGQKTLEGRDLAAGEFTFELYDANNTKLDAVANGADGSFAFKAIPIDRAGEYNYTVRERKGTAEGIAYDEAVYGVKVVVTDNLDGTFKVEYSYSKGAEAASGVTFVNLYTAPAPQPTPDPDPQPTPDPEPQPQPTPDPEPKPEPKPAPSDSPDTGDETNLGLWFALLFASGGGLLLATLYLKKKEETEQA